MSCHTIISATKGTLEITPNSECPKDVGVGYSLAKHKTVNITGSVTGIGLEIIFVDADGSTRGIPLSTKDGNVNESVPIDARYKGGFKIKSIGCKGNVKYIIS